MYVYVYVYVHVVYVYSIVTHSTAISDSVVAIPPIARHPAEGGIDLLYPPHVPSEKRDTLRYLKNIDAIGIAIPYSAIGRGYNVMLGH